MPFTPGRPVAEAEAALFKAMAHPGRVAVLEALADRDLSVGRLAACTGMEMSHLSHQLRLLRASGLVERRTAGRSAIYALGDPQIVLLLSVARGLLNSHLTRVRDLHSALTEVDDVISRLELPQRTRADVTGGTAS